MQQVNNVSYGFYQDGYFKNILNIRGKSFSKKQIHQIVFNTYLKVGNIIFLHD